MSKKEKGFAHILIILLVLAVLVGVGLVIYTQGLVKLTGNPKTSSVTPAPSASPVSEANYENPFEASSSSSQSSSYQNPFSSDSTYQNPFNNLSQ